MRVLLLVIWMLIPIGAVAFHLGPGQNYMKMDKASQILVEADRLAGEKSWAEAQTQYESALSLLPEERVAERRRIQLQRAKMQMENAQLPVAHEDLKSLVNEMMADEKTEPAILEEARSTLAKSQYYITWLMRLEGLPRDKWEPEVISAQQTFRALAKESRNKNETKFVTYTEDLESSVRLARMDLGELQGLPLPSQ